MSRRSANVAALKLESPICTRNLLVLRSEGRYLCLEK